MKYTVVVHYEGAINYLVDAESEEEARNTAVGMFEDEEAETVLESIQWDICDSWEEK